MRRPRLTVRSLMLGVVAIALVLRLIVAYRQVAAEPNIQTLCHLGRFRDDGSLFIHGHGSTPAIFWGKYWRRVLGLPWPGGFVCAGCEGTMEREFGRPVEYIEMANGHDELEGRMAELNRSRKSRQPPSILAP